jgi:hypothetical protein
LLADNTGTVTDSYDYDAYGKMLGGNPLSTTNKAATDMLYSAALKNQKFFALI